MKEPKDTTVATAWFAKGDNDLKTAEIVVNEPDAPTDTVCFHCQQAAEKYFKGYLVNQGVTFFKEHDLIYLLDLCKEKDGSFAEVEEAANTLNNYAVETRYPFEEEIVYTLDEARQALALAKRVKGLVLGKVKK